MSDNYAAVLNGAMYHENETSNPYLKKMYRALRTWSGSAFYIYFGNSTVETARSEAERFLNQCVLEKPHHVFYDSEADFSEAIFLVDNTEFDTAFAMANMVYRGT